MNLVRLGVHQFTTYSAHFPNRFFHFRENRSVCERATPLVAAVLVMSEDFN